jgi:hypothetical protein
MAIALFSQVASQSSKTPSLSKMTALIMNANPNSIKNLPAYYL